MSPIAVHHALRADAPTAPRFVLVVMALHADHNSRCALSLRELGELTGLSPQGVSDALKRLQDGGHVELRTKGAGARSSVYEILQDHYETPEPARLALEAAPPSFTPEPAPVASAAVEPNRKPDHKIEPVFTDPDGPNAPLVLTSKHVVMVIEAARVDTSGQAPLYWSRHEHVNDLYEILRRAGMSLTTLCDALRKAPDAGPIRRLTALQPILQRARA